MKFLVNLFSAAKEVMEIGRIINSAVGYDPKRDNPDVYHKAIDFSVEAEKIDDSVLFTGERYSPSEHAFLRLTYLGFAAGVARSENLVLAYSKGKEKILSRYRIRPTVVEYSSLMRPPS